ncbi:MAG TPA: hypothetical protein VFE21_01020 [Rubrobacteraceae bacterium]|nr:hypothetical protein [Rubrobacteraceae bacterium]
MKHPVHYAVVAGLAVLAGCTFVGMNLVYNGGQLSAPLDDVYIHLQYGRQIGEGEWFRYNDGDPMSTGASSFLYVILLGAARAVGFDGGSLLWFAVVLGVVLLVVTAVLGYELGRRLAGERAGLWSGVLISTNGAFVWGATSGMEIPLLAALLTGTLLAFVRDLSTGRLLFTPLVAALAALTRPEGLVFAGVVTVTIIFVLLKNLRKGRTPLSRFFPVTLYALLPVAAGAGQLLFQKLATGSFSANGVKAKSMLYASSFYPTEFVDQTFRHLTELGLTVFMGLKPANYLFPGAVIFCALGILYLVFRDTRYQTFAGASGVALALAVSSIATLDTWEWHYFRYFMPFFPVMIVFAVVGFYSLGNLERGERDGWVPGALVASALVFSVFSLPMWATTAGGASSHIREQQVTVGKWLRENLPQDARVGINDAGAMRYYGGHPTVDLVGLTTNGLALPYRNGMGSLYEALESMPEDKRPDYFSVYPGWVSGLEASGIIGEEIERFTMTPRPKVAGIVGGDTVVVYEANWDLAGSGEAFTGEGEVRDSLDVAELESEEEHNYETRLPLVGLDTSNILVREYTGDGRLVVDAGRGVPGVEAFTVRNLTADRPLRIEMRTTGAPFTLRVRADGEPAGEWSFRPSGGGWQRASFTIPAELIRSETLRVELLPPEDKPTSSHPAFHYWFVQ